VLSTGLQPSALAKFVFGKQQNAVLSRTYTANYYDYLKDGSEIAKGFGSHKSEKV
jgi:hypothetical protein